MNRAAAETAVTGAETAHKCASGCRPAADVIAVSDFWPKCEKPRISQPKGPPETRPWSPLRHGSTHGLKWDWSATTKTHLFVWSMGPGLRPLAPPAAPPARHNALNKRSFRVTFRPLCPKIRWFSAVFTNTLAFQFTMLVCFAAAAGLRTPPAPSREPVAKTTRAIS